MGSVWDHLSKQTKNKKNKRGFEVSTQSRSMWAESQLILYIFNMTWLSFHTQINSSAQAFNCEHDKMCVCVWECVTFSFCSYECFMVGSLSWFHYSQHPGPLAATRCQTIMKDNKVLPPSSSSSSSSSAFCLGGLTDVDIGVLTTVTSARLPAAQSGSSWDNWPAALSHQLVLITAAHFHVSAGVQQRCPVEKDRQNK